MDIWLAAVLAAWLPVAAGLALLISRSLRHADLRERALQPRTARVQPALVPLATPHAASGRRRERTPS